MKVLIAAPIATSMLLCLATQPVLAVDIPRVVPRMQQIPKPVDLVYANLKRYFTDSSLSNFQLISADEKTYTLVAKETPVGEDLWHNWAYCQTGPVQMVYKLEDGTVTVTVKLKKSPGESTFASVAADFQGRFALGTNQNTVDCTSKFVLEDDILAAAGANPGK